MTLTINEESTDQGVTIEFCCEYVLVSHPREDAQEESKAVCLQLQRRVTSVA